MIDVPGKAGRVEVVVALGLRVFQLVGAEVVQADHALAVRNVSLRQTFFGVLKQTIIY